MRYLELYVRVSGDSDYTKISRDYVLETSAQNGGTALDNMILCFSFLV